MQLGGKSRQGQAPGEITSDGAFYRGQNERKSKSVQKQRPASSSVPGSTNATGSK